MWSRLARYSMFYTRYTFCSGYFYCFHWLCRRAETAGPYGQPSASFGFKTCMQLGSCMPQCLNKLALGCHPHTPSSVDYALQTQALTCLRWPLFTPVNRHLNKEKIIKVCATFSATHLILSIAFRSVPKFMKRMKVPDYKEKSVFGVPLIVHVQRCGFPLPLCLQQALSHLRTHCLDQVRINKTLSFLKRYWRRE